MKKFWNWKKKAVNLESGQEAEERILFMNGVIAEDSWFDDDVTPALFKDELNAGTGDITLWINSPGGDCVAAAQIFNMLSEYPGKVTVKIDGLAASAASVIAMAGTEVWMSPVSMMMIHNPATVAWGDHTEMKSITGRPEFQRMLQDVSEERDGVAFILVFKLSRFGRNAADVLNSLQFIQDYGVNLICVEDGIDSSKDSGKLTITVLSAVAEIERENILVQTMEGRKQKAREGKWNGGQAPFGYDLDTKNSTLVVNEEEAEIVRIIYDKFVHTDMGADAICNYLNQRGYTKKKVRGHELNYFARGLIMKILDNPVYTGKIAYGKNVTEKVKGTRDEYRRVKTDDYLLADGLHEAIVDEETWEAAREKRKRTGVKWNKTHSLEHEHILSGLLKCPVCGAGMAGTVRRRKNKKSGEYKDDFYYRCQHRRKIDEEHFCDFKPSLNQNEINAEVEWFIRGMIADERFHEYIGERLQEKVDVSNLEEERDQLKGQLQQVVGAKNKLLVMLDALDAGDKHYARKFQDMQDRLDNLYDRISDFENEIADVEKKIKAAYGRQISEKQLYQILQKFDILYAEMTDFEKKEFMQLFIDAIELYPEKMDDGRIIRQIDLAFPVYYEGFEGETIRLFNENTVETVVLMTYCGDKRK